MENNKKKEVLFIPRLNMLVTSFSRSMMAWWCSSSQFYFPRRLRLFHFLFIAPLMLIRSPSTIWYSHKLFSPSGWHWNEMYRERKRAQRKKKIRGKEKKNQYRRKTAQEATHFFILFRTHLSFFLSRLERGIFCPEFCS